MTLEPTSIAFLHLTDTRCKRNLHTMAVAKRLPQNHLRRRDDNRPPLAGDRPTHFPPTRKLVFVSFSDPNTKNLGRQNPHFCINCIPVRLHISVSEFSLMKSV